MKRLVKEAQGLCVPIMKGHPKEKRPDLADRQPAPNTLTVL